ncbi:MAG: hypothetical protein ILP12_03965 [Lachnospiraceae bacterium]|nr:hypothetical protein [Lachnospiraceae bacterium]
MTATVDSSYNNNGGIYYSNAGDDTVSIGSAAPSAAYYSKVLSHKDLLRDEDVIDCILDVLGDSFQSSEASGSDNLQCVPPVDMQRPIEQNEFGWITRINGAPIDTRRINIVVNSEARLFDADGICDENGIVRNASGDEIGNVWKLSEGMKMFALVDGSYTISNASRGRVEYMEAGEILQIESFCAEERPLQIEVSPHSLKEVRYYITSEDFRTQIKAGSVFSESEIRSINEQNRQRRDKP